MTKSFKEQEKSIEQLENRLMALKSQQKQTARKRETRRLVLMGRLLENLVQWGEIKQEFVTAKLDGWLTRDYDRSLFDLPPLDKAKTAPAADKIKEQKNPKKATSQKKESTPNPAPTSQKPLPTTTARFLQEKGVSEQDFIM